MEKIADPRDIIIEAGRLREELRPDRREQVHVPGAPGRQQDQIKIAVEQIFGVKVTSVNTLNRQGKRKRTRFGYGKRNNTKRAIVSLAEGDRIDIFGQIG